MNLRKKRFRRRKERKGKKKRGERKEKGKEEDGRKKGREAEREREQEGKELLMEIYIGSGRWGVKPWPQWIKHLLCRLEDEVSSHQNAHKCWAGIEAGL